MDPLDPDSLKPVSLLPVPFRCVFPFRYFNAVQTECFAEVFLSDNNMVISAPTGSGKTVLFELCILRLLGKSLTAEGDYQHVAGARKTVYIAPMKALVQDKVRDWTEKFSSLGVKCQELTSDSGPTNVLDMLDTDIILTTPEKFDVITRRHRDRGGMSFFGDIALLLIDEVHILSETRGAALEAVVSRLKMLARFPEIRGCPLSTIRFVAVSATVPNIEDLAEWLRVPKTGIRRFGEEYRPVKLITKVFGYDPARNDFLFERKLQHFLLDILMHHSRGKPSLVFCSTRKGTQDSALSLVQSVSQLRNQNPFVKNMEHFDRLQEAAQGTSDVHLQQCIRSGVAYHNGGLSMQDRSLVEGLFLKGDILVLCTTSTLAQGVNLPAYAVIIKSTQYYNKTKSGYVEYERSAILQMSGRAGRPQFEDSGVVIIMTRTESLHLYQNLLSGSEPVESQLLPTIVEHLNAEIVLMTVTDCSQAIDWLKCSYLYVRIKKNPHHYNIKNGVSLDQLENKLKDICVQNVNELAKYGLVETDEFGFVLTPLEPGRIMEKYYLRFETMKAITKAPERSTMEDLLHILTKAEELSWIKLRRDEKKRLNDINKDMSGRIRFHINLDGKVKKRIQSDAEKIFVLVNDALSCEPSLLDFSMSQDITGICSTGTRIFRCMSDYFIFLKRFTEIRSGLLLSKCLKQRLWENTKYQIKQLPGVGSVTAKALVTAGVDSFEKLASAESRRLEAITGRKFPYGDQLKALLSDIPPKIEMNLFDKGRDDQCLLTLHRISQPKSSDKNFHMAELVVGNKVNNTLLFRERIRMDQFASPYAVTITCGSAYNEPQVVVIAALISEEHIGVDVVCKLAIDREIKGGELGSAHGQENKTSVKKIHKSSPSGTSIISDSPTVPKLQKKKKSSPVDKRAGASDAPVLEAPCTYPPKNLDPSPLTLATRKFLNKLRSGVKEAPLKDSTVTIGQEQDRTSEIDSLATSATHESTPGNRCANADSSEILSTSHSSDKIDTSHCASLIVPSENLETPRYNAPVTVSTCRDSLPPRFPKRRLFQRADARNEEAQMNFLHELPPGVPQKDVVSQGTSTCTQGPCCSNTAGFTEKSANRNTTSNSRNICDAENVGESSNERHTPAHNDVELQTGTVFNITGQNSGPVEAVEPPPSSSLKNQPATPDLLSSNLRRKIRRTGFSTIVSFPSVKDDAQTNTSDKRLLFPDGSGGQQSNLHGPMVTETSTRISAGFTRTNALTPPLKKDPGQPDIRRTTDDSLYPWRRQIKEEVKQEPDLVILKSIANPHQQNQLWNSINKEPTPKFNSAVGAKETAREQNSVLHKRPHDTRPTRDHTPIENRIITSSTAQNESPSNKISPYKSLKSFNYGFARKSTSNVTSILESAVEDPEEYISLDLEPSNDDDWSFDTEPKRLKTYDFRTNTLDEPSKQAPLKADFSCFKFNPKPSVFGYLDEPRATSAHSGGSMTTQPSSTVTTQPSSTVKQAFCGYKSLFSFL